VKLNGEESPDVSVPTSIKPEPETSVKFSDPFVTLVKFAVEKRTPVMFPVASLEAQVV
jgi:hypothetical protein